MNDTNISVPTNESTATCADSLPVSLSILIITSFGISILYIVLFSFLERRNDREKCKCSGNRPGIIFPTNLLDHCEDRISVAAAFGSMASFCYMIFSGLPLKILPSWAKILEVMIFVLLIGLLYYPLFASLFTKWVLLGSCFGLVYSSMWFVFNMIVVIKCPDDENSQLPNLNIFQRVPILLCLLALIIRFLYRITMSILTLIRNKFGGTTILKENHRALATTHNFRYVKQLLTPSRNVRIMTCEAIETLGRLARIKSFISTRMYQNDPTFQYSPMIICIFTLAIICAYQFGISIVISIYHLRTVIKKIPPDGGGSIIGRFVDLKLLFQVFEVCLAISFVCSSLLTLFMITQILSSYRDSMRRMYKGEAKFLPFTRKDRKPQTILARSFAYAGNQVAYILTGYVIVFLVLVLISIILAYTVVLPIFNVVDRQMLVVVVNLLPGLLSIPILTIILTICSNFLLQSRTKNETEKVRVLAIDNRKIYHNVQYFLFFFYIILGLLGSLSKIIKGALLGLLFLPRVDRCGLLSGFENLDVGHINYISFLHVEECHRHPVLLVFCEFLTEINRKSNICMNNSLRNYGSSYDDTPPVHYIQTRNQVARNRWQKAYTLLRNPSIQNDDIARDFDMLTDRDDGIPEGLHSVA